MITPENKDKILTYLIAQENSTVDVDFDQLETEIGLREEFSEMIIDQFERMGLLKQTAYNGGSIVLLRAEAYDYFNHGGFKAQEELLRANFEKLNYELLKLTKDVEPSHISTIESITGIVASIATALKLFSH